MDKDQLITELTNRIRILESVIRILGCNWFLVSYLSPLPERKGTINDGQVSSEQDK